MIGHERCACGAFGSPVTVRREGVVIWRRILCDDCFQRMRATTQEQTGLAIVPKWEA